MLYSPINMINPIIVILIISCWCTFGNSFTIELIRQSPHLAAKSLNDIPKIGTDWLKSYNLRRDTEYKKYKLDGVPPRINDTIALTRYLDSEFYGEIIVGNKSGQRLNVLFETTWVDSWLISADCSVNSPGCANHTRYDHDKSNSYIEDGQKYTANEGNYTLTGYWSTDFFYLSHLNITNQSFIEMTDIPNKHLLIKADGIFGLGLKVSERNPFFYNLLQQGKIKEPIFSIFLNRDTSSERGGSIFLGGFEPKHVHVTNKVPDQFTEVPLNSDAGYWGFKMDMVAFKRGKALDPIICTGNCNAIIDSGSMDIQTTEANVLKIHKFIKAKINDEGVYTVDCNKINKLPAIYFVFQNKNFTLKGDNYISRVTVEHTTVCTSCFKASATISPDMWVLGGAFLSEYYSVYNIDKRTISFVTAA